MVRCACVCSPPQQHLDRGGRGGAGGRHWRRRARLGQWSPAVVRCRAHQVGHGTPSQRHEPGRRTRQITQFTTPPLSSAVCRKLAAEEAPQAHRSPCRARERAPLPAPPAPTPPHPRAAWLAARSQAGQARPAGALPLPPAQPRRAWGGQLRRGCGCALLQDNVCFDVPGFAFMMVGETLCASSAGHLCVSPAHPEGAARFGAGRGAGRCGAARAFVFAGCGGVGVAGDARALPG
jgi:hypothetical protein